MNKNLESKVLPKFNIVLYQPKIPPNTGNIIRLCFNTGAKLHLIKPLGFEITNKTLKRAGLDHYKNVIINQHNSLIECLNMIGKTTVYLITKFGQTKYCDVSYKIGDTLIFGSETNGLPESLLKKTNNNQKLYIPMLGRSRSLNLSNAVSVNFLNFPTMPCFHPSTLVHLHPDGHKPIHSVQVGDRVKAIHVIDKVETLGYVQEVLCSDRFDNLSRWQNTTFKSNDTGEAFHITHTAQHSFLLKDREGSYAWGNLDTEEERQLRLMQRGTPNASRPMAHRLSDTRLPIVVATNNTDRLTVTGTDITANTGNIVFGTASKGVYLGVTSATAANLLDDYEEGSADVKLRVEGRGDSSVAGTRSSSYTKIGNRVFVRFYMNITSATGTASNRQMQIFNLPFTSVDAYGTSAYGALGGLEANADKFFQIVIDNNSTTGQIQEWDGIQGDNFSDHFDTSQVHIEFNYETA